MSYEMGSIRCWSCQPSGGRWQMVRRHPTGSRRWRCRGLVVEVVSIETFIWTDHALLRLSQRRLESVDAEEAIRANHDERRPNDGQADWLVRAMTQLGVRIEAIYDHPVRNDGATIRIVSAWRVES
jgi:hypothetical protein